MEKNINKTKKNLTIIFSIVVFLVIIILWTTFFSAKYFREVSMEKIEFSNLIKNIDSWNLSIESIIEWPKDFSRDSWEDKVFDNRNLPLRWDDKFKPKVFMNYVYLDTDKNIISSDVKDEIYENFILNLVSNDKYFNLTETSWFLVKVFKLDNNYTFLVLKKLNYSLLDYLMDLLWFIFITLLFSILLYIISMKFVDKAFIPVEENMKDMKDFIHNAGHELKTPISVIDSNIQLIDDLKTYDPEMIGELKKEVIRLNSIIESLIKLSDIELFKWLEKNNLKFAVEEILWEFKFKITDKKISTNINIPENVLIKSNKDYFYMFLSNLIWNAIKYNKDSWAIDISYKNWDLIIKDSGIGIDNQDLPKIFDRFFKSDKSRSSDWFWIWLSLVKKIADIYSWKIRVESEKDKWTSFIIKLS